MNTNFINIKGSTSSISSHAEQPSYYKLLELVEFYDKQYMIDNWMFYIEVNIGE